MTHHLEPESGLAKPSFSVLICTYNRHELLERALKALVEGTREKPSQIVVVNGGDERADRVTERFQGAAGIQVKVVKTVNKNLAASRNLGLLHCTGDLVGMTDDDAEVFPDWVSRMRQAHAEHPEAGAIGGPVLGTNVETLVGRVADVITFPTWETPCDVRTLPGVNISYKRSVLERIGYQDETLFRGEDVDFNWRIIRLGYTIHFEPSIKVYHFHRASLRGFLNQHYMYGRAYYLVRRKWPDMYCVYPHRFRRAWDLVKAVNCGAALLYQPFLSCRKLAGLRDRAFSVPLLFLAGVAWKGGMAVQAYRERRLAT